MITLIFSSYYQFISIHLIFFEDVELIFVYMFNIVMFLVFFGAPCFITLRSSFTYHGLTRGTNVIEYYYYGEVAIALVIEI